jgi:hypothetical protein
MANIKKIEGIKIQNSFYETEWIINDTTQKISKLIYDQFRKTASIRNLRY